MPGSGIDGFLIAGYQSMQQLRFRGWCSLQRFRLHADDSRLQIIHDAAWYLLEQLLLAQHQHGTVKGSGIHCGGAGGNHIERIANDIRDDQADQLPGGMIGKAAGSQLAPFEMGEVLANGIEFANAGPGSRELFADVQLVFERNRGGT